MKERIYLLETNVEEQNRSAYNPNSTYPLGLAYLDSTLTNEGYEVYTKDYADLTTEACLKEIENTIQTFNPKVIGISVMSMTRATTYEAIKLIKRINKDIKIILGGIHASVMYKQLIENFPIDAVVIGEGEETVKELIPALINNKKLNKIKGIAFKSNNEVIITSIRDLICDLDKIPFPNHEPFINKDRTSICMLSSRGCPNQCSFCCLYLITKRRYRMRSYMNVVDEIEYITKKFPQIKKIEFSDDTFTLSEERVKNFCKEILKRKINVEFVCSARINPASEEMFSLMEQAGFREIRFGIETGSPKMLESIHKAITQEQIIRTFTIASKFKKIKFVKFLMVGFPGETDETIGETIELVKKLQKIIPMDFFCATPLWVYPGTEVYDKMKEAGKIDDSYWLTNKPCPHYTVDHTEEKLKAMSNRISFETALDRGYLYFTWLSIKKFYAQPSYYFKRAINLIKYKIFKK